MTAYDHWKTSAPERDDEAWEYAIENVADELTESCVDRDTVVSTLANADAALNWICSAVTLPDQHILQFRDLVKLVSGYHSRVQDEKKAYHDARD